MCIVEAMKLSVRGEYALRALLVLSLHYDENVVRIQTIAEEQQIPKKFLEQILTDLKRLGAVESKRGVHGGYRLARPPEHITLASVVRHVEGAMAPVSCVSERFYERCTCPDEARCAIRDVMKEAARGGGQDHGTADPGRLARPGAAPRETGGSSGGFCDLTLCRYFAPAALRRRPNPAFATGWGQGSQVVGKGSLIGAAGGQGLGDGLVNPRAAQIARDNFAVGADEENRRDSFHAVEVRDGGFLPFAKEALDPLDGVLFGEVNGLGGLGVHAQADHGETGVFGMLVVGGLEIGHFGHAGAAPGGPEIQQHIFAAEVGQLQGMAVGRHGLEQRGGVADAQGEGLLEGNDAEIEARLIGGGGPRRRNSIDSDVGGQGGELAAAQFGRFAQLDAEAGICRAGRPRRQRSRPVRPRR